MYVQACKLTFSSYRLQPLGSYPRIVDKKGSHDLFGPVNKLYCTNYDRAMSLYLACLKVALYPLLSGDHCMDLSCRKGQESIAERCRYVWREIV